jgi:hypothetical protein
MLNLLNNVHQLSNDVHKIPSLINDTLAAILSGAGQAGQAAVQQLIGAVNGASQQGASRNIFGALGQNANLLSSITHLVPKGTSISQVLTLLNLLNNVHQLSNDVHQIPLLINQTWLASSTVQVKLAQSSFNNFSVSSEFNLLVEIS